VALLSPSELATLNSSFRVSGGGYWANQIQSFADATPMESLRRRKSRSDRQRVWTGTPYPTQGAMLTSAWTFGGAFKADPGFDYRAGQTLFNQFAYERCRSGGVAPPLIETRPSPIRRARCEHSPRQPTTLRRRFPEGPRVGGHLVASTAHRRRVRSSIPRHHAGRSQLVDLDRLLRRGPEAGSYGIIQPGEPRGIADVGALPVPRTWTLRLDVTY